MQKYLEKLKIDMELRGMSESTQESYSRRVKTFFSEVNKEIEVVTPDDIRNYIICLKHNKKLSLGTINAYISALKFFYSITLEKRMGCKKSSSYERLQSFSCSFIKRRSL